MELFLQGLPPWANFALFLFGVFVVTKGAGWFTDGAVEIADHTGTPKLVIGATVVSVATTFPEFLVSSLAAVFEHPGTAVGNAVGSTICNIGLIIAIAALIRPMKLDRKNLWAQGSMMWASGALLIFLVRDGVLGRAEGALLLAGMALYMVSSWYLGRGENHDAPGSANAGKFAWGRATLHFSVGAAGVLSGSFLVVQTAAPLARALGVSDLVIGLSLVAVGTSLPELVTAIVSSLRGHGALSAGNVLGANALNILFVLGGASSISPLAIEQQTYRLDFPVMVFLMVLVVWIGGSRGRLGREVAAIFLTIYAVYLAGVFSLFSAG